MSFSAETIRDHNICVIWVDDLFDVETWRSSYGVEIQTPNLDRLMKSGVRFANAYATVPLCSPCRAELATGLSPFRTGLVDLNRIWREALPPQTAWAFDLRRAGFRTFTTGKVDGKYGPMSQEYRRVLFHKEVEAKDYAKERSNVHEYSANKGARAWGVNWPDDDGSQDSTFYDYHVATNAIAYLETVDPRCRHLIQLGFKHPHIPYTCPNRFYDLYDVSKIKWPDQAEAQDFTGPPSNQGSYERAYIANGPWIPERVGENTWKAIVAGYFAAISHMDYHLGRFMDALANSPIAGNTTVVFLSDNGFNLGTHDSFHKMSQWDSAAHIPLGIWNPLMAEGQVVETPVSLHNFAKTILQLAGLEPRKSWISGQSLLPLIDESFGDYDFTKSPVSSVFGTLSVRPSTKELQRYRYFRYPSGEEHVYDLEEDPGETENLVAEAPLDELRRELIDSCLELGLDLRQLHSQENKVNTMVAVDGSVVLARKSTKSDLWAYGQDVEKAGHDPENTHDTLWYMGGPDDYVLNCPMNVNKVRIAAVLARPEDPQKSGRKTISVVAHEHSPIEFETSERVEVDVSGSRGGDVMVGSAYGNSTLRGGAGDDRLSSISRTGHGYLYGEEGDDFLSGGPNSDYLDGGTGNDRIVGRSGRNYLVGGYGNDHITDGEGGSYVYTGPGINAVYLSRGDDVVYVGNGVNKIYPGSGAVQFRIGYGGICTINRWHETQVYELMGWPQKPKLNQVDDSIWQLSLGMSVVRMLRVGASANIWEQVKFKRRQQIKLRPNNIKFG